MPHPLENLHAQQVGKQKSKGFDILRFKFGKSTQASDLEPLLGSSSETIEIDASSTLKQAEGSGIDISGHISLELLKQAKENLQNLAQADAYIKHSTEKLSDRYNKHSAEKQSDYPSRIQQLLVDITLAKKNCMNTCESQNIQNVIKKARSLEMEIKKAIIGEKTYNFVTQKAYTREELSKQDLTSEKLTWIMDIAKYEKEQASNELIRATKYCTNCTLNPDEDQPYQHAYAVAGVEKGTKEETNSLEKVKNAQKNYNHFRGVFCSSGDGESKRPLEVSSSGGTLNLSTLSGETSSDRLDSFVGSKSPEEDRIDQETSQSSGSDQDFPL